MITSKKCWRFWRSKKLHQASKSEKFEQPFFLESGVLKVEFSIICGAFFVFCWHRTPPKIGQLQDAHSELLWKGALFRHVWCLGLCWHPTQPEIGRLQGAPPPAAIRRGVDPSSVVPRSLLAPDSTRNWTISRCPFSAAMKRGVAPNSSVVPWSLLAPDSTRNRTTSRCPF